MAAPHNNSNPELSRAFTEFRIGPVDKVTNLFVTSSRLLDFFPDRVPHLASSIIVITEEGN